jgi:hypothetical protein
VEDPVAKTAEIPIPDLEIIAVYSRRTTDLKLWPKPNIKAIVSSKNAARMVTTGCVASELALEGIVPVVVSRNPRDKLQSVYGPFGPMLSEKHQPWKPGSCYKLSSIYNMFQPKKQVVHGPILCKCLNLSNARKKWAASGCTHIGRFITIGRSYERVSKETSSRLGFNFHGSGGNAAIAGDVPSDAQSKKTSTSTAVAGATFESSQTILNKHNAVMEQVCENGTPVVVFVAGDALPKNLYNSKLKHLIGENEEQAMYLGVYNVVRCAQDSPVLPAHLAIIVKFYEPVYGQLNVMNLCFLLEASKRFRLVPNNDYVPRLGGYYHMEGDTRDDRKPMFQLPSRQTFTSVLRTVPTEGAKDIDLFVSERTMFRDWVRSRG